MSKNIVDFVLAAVLLPFVGILHLCIALAIRLDSKGSVFFYQKRMGRGGEEFICYKYRTMYEPQQAQKLLEEHLHQHPEEKLYYEKYHKYTKDPRITRVGRFLRSSSLDELPQLLNVLKGEMSLIGPRPYLPKESEKMGKAKETILQIKPGITGLWQVSGRNNLSFEKRLELDVEYVKNHSFKNDLFILLKTLKVVLFKTGAR